MPAGVSSEFMVQVHGCRFRDGDAAAASHQCLPITPTPNEGWKGSQGVSLGAMMLLPRDRCQARPAPAQQRKPSGMASTSRGLRPWRPPQRGARRRSGHSPAGLLVIAPVNCNHAAGPVSGGEQQCCEG